MGIPKKDGWANCPKCNLPKFLGRIKPKKKKDDEVEESPQEIEEIEE